MGRPPMRNEATGNLTIEWESSERHRLLESIVGMWDDHDPDASFWQAIQQAVYLYDGEPATRPGEGEHSRLERERLVQERERLLQALADYNVAYARWFNRAEG